jgi:hypothetical protein
MMTKRVRLHYRRSQIPFLVPRLVLGDLAQASYRMKRPLVLDYAYITLPNAEPAVELMDLVFICEGLFESFAKSLPYGHLRQLFVVVFAPPYFVIQSRSFPL